MKLLSNLYLLSIGLSAWKFLLDSNVVTHFTFFFFLGFFNRPALSAMLCPLLRAMKSLTLPGRSEGEGIIRERKIAKNITSQMRHRGRGRFRFAGRTAAAVKNWLY